MLRMQTIGVYYAQLHRIHFHLLKQFTCYPQLQKMTKIRTFATIAFGAVSISCICTPALSATIVGNSSGSNTLTAGYFGQSFTTAAGNSYDTLSFSWLRSDGTTKLADGNLFLLTQEYLSSPASLSSSTSGFVAQSTGISNNEYIFNPSVTIAPLTKYWVYMGSAAAISSVGLSNSDTFAGGNLYFQQGSASSNYSNFATGDTNFVLSSNAVTASTSVPEPFTIVGTLIGGTVAIRLRKKLKSAAGERNT
jgi:hypothetical protein